MKMMKMINIPISLQSSSRYKDVETLLILATDQNIANNARDTVSKNGL